jgi:hypothetical protein
MMFLVILRRSGPEYDHSKPLEEQSGWLEHAAFMDGLVDDGFHAVEAASEQEIRDRLARVPWSGSHLVVDSIDPWTIRLQRLP